MSDLTLSSSADRLARQLLDAADQLTDLGDVNADAGAIVVASAEIPQRSGRLAASVHSAASPGDVVIGSPLRYATFVHWGAPRRGIRARPFLLASAELRQSDLIQLYADHARRVVDTID